MTASTPATPAPPARWRRALRRCWLALRTRLWRRPRPIGDALWAATLAAHPFLQRLDGEDQARLRRLCAHFLAQKRFSSAHGLRITDEMALAVAAQACLPLLRLGSADAPEDALHWYGDFVGIVMHPGPALAQRDVVDAAGVVHRQAQALLGEAMQGGPVMLSWPDVRRAAEDARHGRNLVIHEFAHKLDMQSGQADGAPPLHARHMGARGPRAAARQWQRTWTAAYERFREQAIMAERFGGEPPWLDAYAATSPAEFFAVACEAHFTQPETFARDWPDLAAALRAFFRQTH